VCSDGNDGGDEEDVEYYVKPATSKDKRKPHLITKADCNLYRGCYEEKKAAEIEEVGRGKRKVLCCHVLIVNTTSCHVNTMLCQVNVTLHCSVNMC